MPRKSMPAGPGRPKGSKNKVSRDIRKYIVDVAAQLEAEGRGLKEWAESNPDLFWSKVFKAVVPKEVSAEVKGSMRLEVITGIDRAPNED